MPVPDPAASVILLRPEGDRFQVLMVQRNSRGFFGSLLVFPGGGVHRIDADTADYLEDDLAHRRAALRELAEETGILLTTNGPVAAPGLKDDALYEWMRVQSVEAAVDQLTMVSRWVTPDGAPRRFDARFYLVGCDDVPDVVIDTEELVAHHWTDPSDALERHARGEVEMMLPTIAHLRWLSKWRTIREALESAAGADGRTAIRPARAEDGSFIPVHIPAGDA